MTTLRIAELRKEKNISQEELADILNTSRQAVSKWERGESYPDIDRLKELAIYFNVSIDYILGYDVESNSVDSFIKRLEACINNKRYDVSIDEIKMMVIKNCNNITVLVKSVSYLFLYWNNNPSDETIDLIIEYCKKALILHREKNAKEFKINDIHLAIVGAYSMKKRYDLVKKHIIENEVYDSDTFLAEAELELGNHEEASNIISNTFLHSIATIINGNIIQTQVLIQNSKIKDAYDLTNWSISFIKSIAKNENLFIEVIYIFTFSKAICEKNLNLDYKESLDFLKENYDHVINNDNDSENIKFYYGEQTSFFNIFSGIKTIFKEFIDKLSNENNLKNDALYVFNELFGEKENG